ncbi:MAG: MFS transporter [Agathobacter sp.]
MSATKVQRAALHVAVLTAFLTTFSSSCMNLSIPNMEAEFRVSAAAIGWVITAYVLATAAMSIPFGKIADVKGRRKVMIVGIGGYMITSLCLVFVPHFSLLIGGRVIQGLFASMLFATNNAILISVYPPEKRGQMLGISISATYIGLAAGPVAGGFLNHYIGWRSIFLITAVIAFVAFILALRGVPRIPVEDTVQKPDILGNILFIAAIVITLYGLTNLTVMKLGWLILVIGLAIGVAFVCLEMKVENPVVRITMFTKCRAFTFSNFAALLNYASTYAISYLMSIYLQVVKGYESQVAGIIMVSMPIVQAIFTPYMGKLSDRVKPHKMASLGMGICAVGLVLLACVGEQTSLSFVIVALFICGFSFAVFSSPNTNAILSLVKKEEYAIANSILSTMRTVGQSLSMAIVTIIVGMTLGNIALEHSAPADLVKTMHVMFVICVVMCVAGVFLSLQRRKEK